MYCENCIFVNEGMKDQILITNIQRFSLHDGPGIRTTVFCKGCSLRCPWCANPENLEARLETYVKDGKSGIYGRFISKNDLYETVMRDEPFYRQQGQESGLAALPGGVTYSGGEAMLQADSLSPLFQRLKMEGVHQCVETSLFISSNQLELAMKFIDLFYVDIKILDKERCKSILHGKLEQYLANVKVLFETKKPVIFRMPIIGGYTDREENIRAVVEFIKQYPPIKVELIKEHNLGQSKYKSLGKTPLDLHTVTDDFMEKVKREIQTATNTITKVCKV